MYKAQIILLQTNTHKMKKLLLVLAIGAFVASCNNAADSAAKAADSTATVIADSAKAKIDSVASKADSTVKAVVDSTKAKVDSLKK
jgi:hypothetical protein